MRNIYRVSAAFPLERHLIDVLTFQVCLGTQFCTSTGFDGVVLPGSSLLRLLDRPLRCGSDSGNSEDSIANEEVTMG